MATHSLVVSENATAALMATQRNVEWVGDVHFDTVDVAVGATTQERPPFHMDASTLERWVCRTITEPHDSAVTPFWEVQGDMWLERASQGRPEGLLGTPDELDNLLLIAARIGADAVALWALSCYPRPVIETYAPIQPALAALRNGYLDLWADLLRRAKSVDVVLTETTLRHAVHHEFAEDGLMYVSVSANYQQSRESRAVMAYVLAEELGDLDAHVPPPPRTFFDCVEVATEWRTSAWEATKAHEESMRANPYPTDVLAPPNQLQNPFLAAFAEGVIPLSGVADCFGGWDAMSQFGSVADEEDMPVSPTESTTSTSTVVAPPPPHGDASLIFPLTGNVCFLRGDPRQQLIPVSGDLTDRLVCNELLSVAEEEWCRMEDK